MVCGGYDRGECLNKVEAYNVSSNIWEKWPSMLSKRGRFAVATYENLIYAVGGSNGHSEEASVEIYDPSFEKWNYGPSLPVALSNIGKNLIQLLKSTLVKKKTNIVKCTDSILIFTYLLVLTEFFVVA